MGPGQVVADRFEIQSLAGSGGSASVFRAIDRESGQPVAIKILHGGLDAQAVERFAQEARVLAQLSHGNIVRYLAHGRVGADLFTAMEWLDGSTLAQRLTKKPLTIEESIALVESVAGALGIAHRQAIVHRDVKPANIFLVDGDASRAKLLDFGVARLRSSLIELTLAGAMIGTPGYMAPEQVRGERGLDARADVFSLGCVFYRCLTTKAPFSGRDMMAVLAKVMLEEPEPVRVLRPEVPPALEQLVLQMLSKRPEDRPADATIVSARLASLSGGPAGDSLPPSEAATLTTDERRMMCVLLSRPPSAEWSREDGIGSAHAALRVAVAAHGGRLDVLADRSLLVTLEEPGTPADDAARTARCAIAMRALVPTLPIALVAGERETQRHVAMGPVIDRGAALLRSLDGRGAVRLDRVVAGFLDGRFDVRQEGGTIVLLGEREAPSLTRTFLGKPSPCVGRERDLAMLENVWAECVEESVARIALVTGPAGIGKSRVLDEFLRRAARGAPDVEIWVGRADPMGGRSPFGMIADPLRHAAGIRVDDTLSERRDKLRARVERFVRAGDVERVSAFLGEVVGAPFPADDSVELQAARDDPQLMGDQMRRAWEDWVDAESQMRPLLLVLEDLHWGDLPSVDLVDAVVRHLEARRFMVLALARPEVYTGFPNIWTDRSLTELRLGRLTEKAATKLVREALGADAPAATIARIVERGDGNAFFLEELIRAVVDGKGDELPTTVLAMVQARLGSLSVEARRFLRAASVFGRVVPSAGVAALLGGEDAPRREESLTELVSRDIIRRPTEPGARGELSFHHAIIHEAAYSMLTDADRKLGHRLAAEWLERADEADPMVLAEHFERGGEALRAVAWYRRAAENALGGNNHASAIQRAERAVACGASGDDEGRIRLIESEARRWRGENELARGAAVAAMSLLPIGTTHWCDAASELGAVCGSLGDTAQLVALAEELEAVAPAGSESQLVNALARVVRPLFWSGKHGLASRLLARAGELCDGNQALQPTCLAALYMARGVEARLLGDPSECVRWNELAVEQSERIGDLRAGCVERGNLGYAYLEIGAYEEAEKVLTEALVVAARLGLPLVRATAQQNLGLALGRRGAFDRALHLERTSLSTFEAQGDHRRAGCSLLYLALILVDAGTIHEAEHAARRAVDMLAQNEPLRCNALAVLAQIQLASGQVGAAIAAANDAFAALSRLGTIDEGESRVRLVNAEALRSSGDVDAARAAMAVALEGLLARAGKLPNGERRRAFLQIPENARTIDLAIQWGIAPA